MRALLPDILAFFAGGQWPDAALSRRERELLESAERMCRHAVVTTPYRYDSGSPSHAIAEFLTPRVRGGREELVRAYTWSHEPAPDSAGEDDSELLKDWTAAPMCWQPDLEPAVEVRDCGERGLGVFATRSVRPGDTLTGISGVVTLYEHIGVGDHVVPLAGWPSWLASVKAPSPRFLASRLHCIECDPLDERPGLCGQLINDASAVFPNVEDALGLMRATTHIAAARLAGSDPEEADVVEQLTALAARVALYSTVSGRGCNVVLGAAIHPAEGYSDGAMVGRVVATRAIAAGEEVLTSYGARFWLRRAWAGCRDHFPPVGPAWMDDVCELDRQLRAAAAPGGGGSVPLSNAAQGFLFAPSLAAAGQGHGDAVARARAAMVARCGPLHPDGVGVAPEDML